MGLLDTIGTDQGGGGLLDALLRSFQQNADAPQLAQMGPQPSDMAQYSQPVPMQPPPVITAQPNAQPSPPMPAPGAAPIVSPPQTNAQPGSSGPAMFAQPTAATPSMSLGDRIGAGFRGVAANMSGGPLGMLAGGVAGMAGMGKGTAEEQEAKKQGFAANALLQKGATVQDVQAGINNPEVMKALVAKYYPAQTPAENLGQGYIRNTQTGEITRAYKPEQNDNYSVVQKGEDAMGNKTFVKLNKATGEETPMTPDAGAAPGGGLGDMSKTGPEYLATLPPLQQKIVAGMIDGTVQPPSSFALAKKSWQAMLAAAKNVDPSFDENTWTSRHKMATDIAASGNSSMGGILANGKSSFSHLADLSDSMAGLGNASHDFPGGGIAAHAQNYLGNSMGGSDTMAKIKAINDNLGHYGQESTKFYSGTGGGAEERMNALKEMNPTSTSSEEMASYVNKEKDLMVARLREKEDGIRKTMGDAYLQQHPVFTPQFQQVIDRIDANVAKLNGKPGAPSGAAAKPATVMQNGHSYSLQPDGSYK